MVAVVCVPDVFQRAMATRRTQTLVGCETCARAAPRSDDGGMMDVLDEQLLKQYLRVFCFELSDSDLGMM